MKVLEQNYLKKCPRCGKSFTSDEICIICKSELLMQYNHEVDWKTAYQIEREVDEGKSVRINF